MEVIKSGTVILDISDHFMTFIQLPNNNAKAKSKQKLNRNFRHENVENFKANLQTQSWENVLNCYDVNESYNLSWHTFKFLFEVNFPRKAVNPLTDGSLENS
jgi:hypothetical protein